MTRSNQEAAIRFHRIQLAVLLFAAIGINGCTAGSRVSIRTSPAVDGEEVATNDPAIGAVSTGPEFTIEPWSFHESAGMVILSPHYRIFTTGEEEWMQEYAARFCELALANYRTMLADLPPPESPLDVYLFARREEWQQRTRELMKEQADLYLNLGRGGFSTQGQAVVYDIGFSDTFAILAHEGWHQYTQTTFKHPLPTWLEEGIASLMEGRTEANRVEVEFDPWSNRARLEALARAKWRKKLIPLRELVDSSPQSFLEEDNGQLLTYYAQVWALSLFLLEGEEGAYQNGLRKVLEDAVSGKMAGTIAAALRRDMPTSQRRRMSTSLYGPGVILAYFNADFGTFAEQYDKFIDALVREGRFSRAYRRTFDRSER